ncbi:sodium:proton antiporter [Peloplasma aerotolerans]|jgi:multicomponent Na+:H+ antiporter subunit C|uniref:Cation:proton antiporter subunit C n=1 Tax=Peloplasma aerotolerans TaxID=3044389 RepID=A0AAW6U5M5_9MOLU|nr:cation:proton antiporter subunit C [Mariniplasma sp. M4Ah]MDI6453276.1 cation:proton antiporter subunit C [Mariniplasma sp. M4Ah]MDR4968369.1 cation:proton antiporter subunit C [Acholeplasmataceae bacterium]
MNILNLLLDHINYIGAVALFIIGLHTVVTHRNLIKRILGVNIMGTSVFLFFIAIGNVALGQPPIIIETGENVIYINPLPSVLILTGIVVVVSMTVYSLSLIIRIYQTYGTIDQEEIVRIQNEENTYD